jgi:fumarate hydratase class II
MVRAEGIGETRTERDSLGAVEVPTTRLWGAQTQRSLAHFAISTERMPPELILALVETKAACARVNAELGLLATDKAEAILAAADEVIGGLHTDEFPLAVWQTGSGTHTNMNVNEVLANRASELLGGPRGVDRLVHPNNEVNLGQSSNDIFPTAMHLAVARAVAVRLLPAHNALHVALDDKARAFADIVKIGRTHLQDATPLTLGQEFSGYAAQLKQIGPALQASLSDLCLLAVGGTAVGSGLNTHPEFGARVAADLALHTGLGFESAPNKFAAIASHDAMVSAHGVMRTLAVVLTKIANDIRWLASGPRSGLGEIELPANEPGSSIMPGKVNPTQCEALTMLAAQVMGNDVAMGFAGASGHFELNVYKPLIAYNFLQSARLLADGMSSFEKHCVRGIEARRERIAELVEQSLMLVTALTPHIGYEKAARIAMRAHADGGSLRAAALALGDVSAEQFDRWVVPAQMVGPRER